MMLPASVMNPILSGLIGVAIFIAASVTDMLDGKIARKYGLVTDFGKLMDPLADKFMVIGALAVIVYRAGSHAARLFFTLVLLVVIFRELAVTSLRLVASTTAGAVVAANLLGKIKTVTQIVFISTVFIEPALYAIPALKSVLPAWWVNNPPLSYVTGGLTLLFTVWSGINYFIGMWKYLDPEK
jgi:CDP-diacylglycerol--glycerol-3-phosphate 3-phosphatidyltransferase